MYPAPSSSSDIPNFPPLAGSGLPDPFHYLIKIFAIAYQVTQVLVRPDVIDAADLLEKAQSDLNEFNSSLPAELRFETSTFRNYAAISQGGAFVLIHVSPFPGSNVYPADRPSSCGSTRQYQSIWSTRKC
jgi:hypothetical protein